MKSLADVLSDENRARLTICDTHSNSIVRVRTQSGLGRVHRVTVRILSSFSTTAWYSSTSDSELRSG